MLKTQNDLQTVNFVVYICFVNLDLFIAVFLQEPHNSSKVRSEKA